jgi:RNA polymerase sigma-32 factor
MNLTLSPCIGSFDSYVRAVNSFPILTLEEELKAARKFREDGDLDAAQKLIVSHLRIVVKVVRTYAGYGLPQEDLVQEGNIGLMKAVKNFDPDNGVRLVSYALHWIRAEIQEFVIKNWRLVKIATTHAQRKLFFNLRSLKKSLAPLKLEQIAEIAQSLNVSERDVYNMDCRLYSGKEVSIEKSETVDDENVNFYPILAADHAHQPENILEESHRFDKFHLALDTLDPRSRRIIETRWLNEGQELTLLELSKEMGISQERVRQIEQAALKKMKSILEKNDGIDRID